ncbi:SAM-dependent methyltransferase [Aphanothece hegewaldii CCALA 016]|uniref:SAM-dependent methyltransferase n=1 Tax=Aphanothece hegewaldii CCALA 016 TaxID=2107694 RepID=A0A2T1LW87_9CHRO|nr:class I SAM-dependent methyltransferase [Aphanothece hegewaldii]PSF36172.1 SAM-dependent methyltransferase [Aphanothece hegewaldii CCALA 016]
MIATHQTQPSLVSRLINGIFAVKPLYNVAKHQARQMMITRAEKIGVPWRDNVNKLRSHDWEKEKASIESPNLVYPDYYLGSIHAYENGDLDWLAALEAESASYTVHSTIWKDTDGISVNGDPKLRQAYHNVLKSQLSLNPQTILDLGCSVGMSTFALKENYPKAKITGLDLSPLHLSVAQYRTRERNTDLNWIHANATSIPKADQSFDLVSSFLMFHEIPQITAKETLQEVRRILRPNGYFTMMDMNPKSEAYSKMPPYIFTLLKSTEPYLDQYFTLDITSALLEAGFKTPHITIISPRHRAIVAQVF